MRKAWALGQSASGGLAIGTRCIEGAVSIVPRIEKASAGVNRKGSTNRSQGQHKPFPQGNVRAYLTELRKALEEAAVSPDPRVTALGIELARMAPGTVRDLVSQEKVTTS